MRNLITLFLSVTMMIGLCSCTDRKTKLYKATISASVSEIPESFDSLLEDIKDETCITLILQGENSDDDHVSLELTPFNEFISSEYVVPGEYVVCDVKLEPQFLLPFAVKDVKKLKEKKFTVKAEHDTSITLNFKPVSLPETSKDILKTSPYTHRIQIDKKVYDIESLTQNFEFDKSILEGRTGEPLWVGCKDVAGLHILLSPDKPEEILGVSFSSGRCVLWGGLRTGMPLEEFTHSEKGILGTPSYCDGSPLVGQDIDDTYFSYLNIKNDDIIKIRVPHSGLYAEYIEFCFGSYAKEAVS